MRNCLFSGTERINLSLCKSNTSIFSVDVLNIDLCDIINTGKEKENNFNKITHEFGILHFIFKLTNQWINYCVIYESDDVGFNLGHFT